MTLLRRAPREAYRVYTEEEFFAADELVAGEELCAVEELVAGEALLASHEYDPPVALPHEYDPPVALPVRSPRRAPAGARLAGVAALGIAVAVVAGMVAMNELRSRPTERRLAGGRIGSGTPLKARPANRPAGGSRLPAAVTVPGVSRPIGRDMRRHGRARRSTAAPRPAAKDRAVRPSASAEAPERADIASQPHPTAVGATTASGTTAAAASVATAASATATATTATATTATTASTGGARSEFGFER
jgi:hypothetical protein